MNNKLYSAHGFVYFLGKYFYLLLLLLINGGFHSFHYRYNNGIEYNLGMCDWLCCSQKASNSPPAPAAPGLPAAADTNSPMVYVGAAAFDQSMLSASTWTHVSQSHIIAGIVTVAVAFWGIWFYFPINNSSSHIDIYTCTTVEWRKCEPGWSPSCSNFSFL